MKKFLKHKVRAPFLILSVLVVTLLFGCEKSVVNVTDTILDIGVPYSQQYPVLPAGDQSRVPWDMKLHDGKLYVSAGNYNDNTGPIGICWYDTKKGEWTTGGYFVSEEQVHSFCEVEGVLTIPGTDAVSGNIGNYYQLKNGEWEQYAVFPGAKHVFDICRFDEKIFAAVGADAGASPIRVSDDEGETFNELPISANGTILDMSIYDMVRAYFLFEYEDNLYTLLFLEIDEKGKTHVIAHYDNATQTFVVFNDFNDVTPTGTALGMKHTFFTESVTWNKQTYFTNGKLIQFTGKSLKLIGSLDNSIVYDLLVYEDRLYVLTCKGEGANITTTVYCTTDGEEFSSVLEFNSFMYAVSFEMDDNNFYFGMADMLNPESKETGSIFMVKK